MQKAGEPDHANESGHNANLADAMDYAAIFMTLLSLSIAGCIYSIRMPFGSPSPLVIVHGSLIVGAAAFAWCELWRRGYHVWSALGPMVVVALPCLAFGQQSVGWAVGLVLAAITVIGIRRTASQIIRQRNSQYLMLLLALPLGAGYFVYVNSMVTSNVLRPEFTLAGASLTDALYHAAIASMIAQHGVVSTGLDGLVLQHYHFLSHVWIGLTSRWLGVSAVDGYYLVPQIVGIPMFLFATVIGSLTIFRNQATPKIGAGIVLVPLVALCLSDFSNTNSYLTSESYMLATTLLLLWLPALLHLADRKAPLWAYPALSLVGGLIMTAKVSVGFIWFCMLGYVVARFLFKGAITVPRRLSTALLVSGLTAAIGYFTITYVLPSGYAPLERPMIFAYSYPAIFAANIVYIIGGAIAALLAFRAWPDAAGPALPVVVIGLAVAAVATMLLSLGSGETYFLDVGARVAVVIMSAFIIARFQPGRTWLGLGVLTAVLFVGWTFVPEKKASIADFQTLTRQVYDRTVPFADPAYPAPVDDSVWARLVYAAHAIQTAPAKKSMDYLRSQIGYGTADIAVFAPPSNTAFWKLTEACIPRPFLVPAMLAVPMMNGLPPPDGKCDNAYSQYYGFDHYTADTISVEMDDRAICDKARRIGYGSIFVLTDLAEGYKLDCSP